MKALTEPQPRASLVTAGVVTVLTRPRPTSYRGRIAIHAGKARPEEGAIVGQYIVDWGLDPGLTAATSGTPHMGDGQGYILLDDEMDTVPLPLGAVVGSAVLTDCVPIVHRDTIEGATARGPRLIIVGGPNDSFGHTLGHFRDDGQVSADVSDQLPFGDFTPGRWALLLDDAKPITERCPWCWGATGPVEPQNTPPRLSGCPVCRGLGRCDPVPARGHSGLWEWTP